jgi:hypothetical protein
VLLGDNQQSTIRNTSPLWPWPFVHILTQPCRVCIFAWYQEKAACLSALKAGYGKQYYHMSGPPAKSTDHRVQQRRGQVLVEDKDGWGALVRVNVQTCLSWNFWCLGCGLRVYFMWCVWLGLVTLLLLLSLCVPFMLRACCNAWCLLDVHSTASDV